MVLSVATDRARTYSQYTSLSPNRLREEKEKLAPLDDRELMLLFHREGNYVARDILIERRVFADTASASISDYAHHLAVKHRGWKRIAKPVSELPRQWRNGRLRRPTGLWVPDGRRLQVRTHARTPASRSSRGGHFAVKPDPWQRAFHAMFGVLLSEDLSVEGAWIIPWDVAEDYANASGLKVDGPWREDPRTEPVDLNAGPDVHSFREAG